MSLEKLLGSLLQSGLSRHVLGGKKKKYKHSYGGSGLGGIAGKALGSKGGLALLASIGMAAYEQYRQRQSQNQSGYKGYAPPPPHPSYGSGNQPPFQRPWQGHTPTTPDADLLLTAMVAAAKADGVLDAEERARLENYLIESGADRQDWGHLDRLMRQPVDLDALIARVRDPVTAAEVYGAAFLAIDVDTPAERAFLAMLAARLGLDEWTARDIESRLME
ncbi:tellurite resistance TerB family protein [Niveispirillum sp. SYP-B3756]|uniref:tellurite resistance TerB family protein n=1 Tax=Niveispirillum sp. SYP-B3756 TaxID=2662178 RepID=UPI001566C7A8|nr:tellurite resistance TerB family protein [Niveispirillum sp. SYP-B3756]